MSEPVIGLINLYKLPGISSHDVVFRVRRIIGIKRVGHAGTLDPVACGVLPMCVGYATRLMDYIADGPKSYRAELIFGMPTDSGDAEGAILKHEDAGWVTEAHIAAVLPRFTGEIKQHPPARSAVWIDGVRAYHLARRGEEFEMPERDVTIHALTPVRFVPGPQPRLLVDITCSKGTYIRSLAIDIGEAVGPGASLRFLARTAVGNCLLEDALTLDELADAVASGETDRWLQPPDAGLTHLQSFDLPSDLDEYHRGITLRTDRKPGLYRAYQHGRFRGVARVEDGVLRPVMNLHL